jgi:hypothetical protein
MDQDRIDFSALDTLANDAVHERLAARIVAAASVELGRRANVLSPFAAIAGWTVPALSAAALIAGLAVATLATVERSAAEDRTMPEALRLPAPVAAWLSEDRSPTNSDLILAVEGGLP